MESYTMRAYTRRMTDELAAVTQRHIQETIAQGNALNWSRGRKQEELRRRFLEEQSKRPDLDMSKVYPNVETVVRTESMKIMGAESWRSAMEVGSFADDLLWGFTYNAVGDSRTRETHLAQDGVSAAFNDPFWDTWTPPNGYNCRCWVISEFDEPDTIKPPHRELQPDKGFAFNPAKQIAGPVRAPKPTPTSKPVTVPPIQQMVKSTSSSSLSSTPSFTPSSTRKVKSTTSYHAPQKSANEPSRIAARKEVQPIIDEPKTEVKPTGTGFAVEPDGKNDVVSEAMAPEVKAKAETVRTLKEASGGEGDASQSFELENPDQSEN